MADIALFLPIGHSYSRKVARGVAAYSRARRGWSLSLLVYPGADGVKDVHHRLQRHRPDGIIAEFGDPQLAEVAREYAPVVTVNIARHDAIACVGPDYHAAGRLAGEHFVERGLRSFAFVGLKDHRPSTLCREGFSAAVAGRGMFVSAEVTGRTALVDPLSFIPRWGDSMSRPIGLMAIGDFLAARALTICARRGISVPGDVALIGVGNDDIACELAPIPLSSVDVSAEAIGQQAARVLDDLIAGRPIGKMPMLMPPRGLVVRQSSDVTAVESPEVAKALRFIQQQSHRPLGVDEVVKSVGISRRGLEQRFRDSLARSIAQEVFRAHIARATELLVTTDLPIAEVAQRSGFKWLEHFCQRFGRHTGMPPAKYRKQFRVLG